MLIGCAASRFLFTLRPPPISRQEAEAPYYFFLFCFSPPACGSDLDMRQSVFIGCARFPVTDALLCLSTFISFDMEARGRSALLRPTNWEVVFKRTTSLSCLLVMTGLMASLSGCFLHVLQCAAPRWASTPITVIKAKVWMQRAATCGGSGVKQSEEASCSRRMIPCSSPAPVFPHEGRNLQPGDL